MNKLISIKEIIKQGLKLYINNFRKFIYLILIILAPMLIYFYLLVKTEDIWSFALAFIVFLIILVINLWITIYLIELINLLYLKKTAD